MKPWKNLARDGDLLLQERDGVFVIRVGGHELMSSLRHGSEEEMARVAGLEKIARPTVLIGGLGLGYTARATLDLVGKNATVVVAEVSAAVVEWNRGVLGPLADHPLDDPRVVVEIADVGQLIRKDTRRYDAVLLDSDNGPTTLSFPTNGQLYQRKGLAAWHNVLTKKGVLVVWSAGPDVRFMERLHEAGFDASEMRVSARAKGSAQHTLFIGKKR